ncbi:single-stranded DNA-binding protein [Mycoplasmatota bacterium WC44]
MLNQIILVGQLIKDVEINESSNGRKKSTIEVEVKRNYRDAETGEYDSDIIKCTLWEGLAESVVNHCIIGSTIGIKARLQSTHENLEVIAEKITFINTRGNDE